MTVTVDGLRARECVGCGYCCRTAPCMAAQRVYGPVDTCPGLKWDGAKYRCELCEKPGDIGARYREELAIGAGCCSPLNSDRQQIPPPVPPVLLQKHVSEDLREFLRQLPRFFITGDQIWLTLDAASKKFGKAWMKEALSVFKEQRPKHMDDFMGEVHETTERKSGDVRR
jgi:hypothetical protein